MILRASNDDCRLLAELGAATFKEAFGYVYPPDDLRGFLAEAHSEDAWQERLADSTTAIWIARLPDGMPLGYISVGACKLPVGNPEASAGEVHQLYVLAQYQNLRLGSQLMDIGLAWLEEQGRTPLYIGVWSENVRAQRFYARYGFEKFAEYGFRVGNTVDREFILKR